MGTLPLKCPPLHVVPWPTSDRELCQPQGIQEVSDDSPIIYFISSPRPSLNSVYTIDYFESKGEGGGGGGGDGVDGGGGKEGTE